MHPPRHRASPSDDGDPAVSDAITRRPSAPNIYTLRRCASVISDIPSDDRRDGRWLWRIAEADWAALCADRRMANAADPDHLLLWNVPVETVPNARGRFPELVWVIGARTAR